MRLIAGRTATVAVFDDSGADHAGTATRRVVAAATILRRAALLRPPSQ
jgi:hypothetical protein